MPVRLELRVKKGWKETENSRFGPAMEVLFIDTKTNKTLFIWAPLLSDEDKIGVMWSQLHTLDKLNKQYAQVYENVAKANSLPDKRNC